MSNNFIDPTERLLDPKDDIVFKFLLTAKNEYSGKTLKSLISAFTGRKVTEVKIAENEPQGGNINEKHIRLDVNCVFDENKLANVEMTMNATGFEFIRLEQYVARLYGSQSTKGMAYQDFPDAYQISIIGNRILTQDDEDVISNYGMCNLKTKKSSNGKMHIVIVELQKIKGKLIEDMDLTERWSAFFAWMGDKTKIDEVNKLISLEEDMEIATNALRSISDDELLRMQIISQQKLKNDWGNDMATSRVEGEVKGKAKERVVIAKNLLNYGVSIEIISKSSGLSVKEIKKLRQLRR